MTKKPFATLRCLQAHADNPAIVECMHRRLSRIYPDVRFRVNYRQYQGVWVEWWDGPEERDVAEIMDAYVNATDIPDVTWCPPPTEVDLVARHLRTVLRAKFPGVTFEVDQPIDFLEVSWKNGPTRAAVEEITRTFNQPAETESHTDEDGEPELCNDITFVACHRHEEAV